MLRKPIDYRSQRLRILQQRRNIAKQNPRLRKIRHVPYVLREVEVFGHEVEYSPPTSVIPTGPQDMNSLLPNVAPNYPTYSQSNESGGT